MNLRLEDVPAVVSAGALHPVMTIWRLITYFISLAAIVYSIWFTWAAHTGESFGDFWSWPTQYEHWLSGQFSFDDLISRWNDHRIATARLVFLGDTLLFRMEGILPSAVMLGCAAACGILIAGWAAAALLRPTICYPGFSGPRG